ncbi:MAG: hypothetical protein JEZ06_23345, partial [Anaerolineaceae bacterium]|nr:hypothetical protein [Anaerolineaceae bacterium]
MNSIRSSGKRIISGLFFLLILLSASSCNRFIVYPSELTATALANFPTSPITTQEEYSHIIPTQSSEITKEISNSNPTPVETEKPLIVSTAEETLEENSNQQLPISIQETLTPNQYTPTPENTSTPKSTIGPPFLYYTQSGDTLDAIAARFMVNLDMITSPEPFPQDGFIDANHLLLIPNVIGEHGPSDKIIPDSEFIFSPTAIDFNIEDFVSNAGGYLSTYKEYRSEGWLNGAQVVEKIALENSINPRLLLSILEQQSGWVYGQPENIAQKDYPIGHVEYQYKGLYHQLRWCVEHLAYGYYGWRQGTLTEITFPDESVMRLDPQLNAGTIALQFMYANLFNEREWGGMLYAPDGLPSLHEKMFGNPWIRDQAVNPLFPINIEQPEFDLPFREGETWNFTGGPHPAWGPNGCLSALDFAPPMDNPGCLPTEKIVTAITSGLVVRTAVGVVVVDTDGDGIEQTGWSILYVHVGHVDKVEVGTWVNTNDKIGYPSCEGGYSTGTHIHVARKYNGEWIAADGPLPFELSGWTPINGEKPYEGMMVRNDEVAI